MSQDLINKSPDMQVTEAALPNNLLQLIISLHDLIDEPDQPSLFAIYLFVIPSANTVCANDDIFEGPLSHHQKEKLLTADDMVPKNMYWSGDCAQPDGDAIVNIKESEDYIMFESHITPQPSPDTKMGIDMTMPTSRLKECFRNLVIKNKALYQPQFQYRWHSEDCKTDEAAESSIELHDGIYWYDDKVLLFVLSRLEAKETLDTHYNNTFHHRWHTWEFKKDKEAKFSEAIEAVFDMLYDAPKEKVLFIIGLGMFFPTASPQHFMPPLAPNPCDHGFIARNNTRQCYCPKCWTFFHQDVMAAQNMIRAAQEHLTLQHRPICLQPTDDDRNPHWQLENAAENQ
ncbi:hypothetical protein BGZ82_001661 [Podila clonocystis]|nr:hypothetical protein BGZ82_001661 [Podila clonocystis]